MRSILTTPKPGSNAAAFAAGAALLATVPIAMGYDATTISATCFAASTAVGAAFYFANTELGEKDFVETVYSISNNVYRSLGNAVGVEATPAQKAR